VYSKTFSNIKIVLITFFFSFTASGQVKLPRLISDGMVIQREADVKIWGWASPGEKISVAFDQSVYKAITSGSGKWEIRLSGLKSGGPYTMRIQGMDTITLNDILVGDVWICSGQSNMELPMSRVSPLYEAEIKNSDNPFIRYFAVPQKYNFNLPMEDLESGKWLPANSKNILAFSAVAYFFADELYKKYKVPVGLINASLGGSPAEAWLSEEALKEFPDHYQEALRFRDSSLINRIENGDRARIRAWYRELNRKDEGLADPHETWYNPGINFAGWSHIKIPGYWASAEPGEITGSVWFRKEISITSDMLAQPAKLLLGRIVDSDSVFVNGIFIGTTGYQYPPRRYTIPEGVLKEGKNTIVVRVINPGSNGGFVPDKPYELSAAGKTIDLKGDWQFRNGARMEPLGPQTFVRWKPMGLYNAMISPLTNFCIRGVIWYQGESNAERPKEYAKMFPALIHDWRSKWKQGDFPFLFVQLANFMEAKNEPSESHWALLREAQLKTLSVPNTGMAVTIDIGEWNDIHPLNKKDVGSRLALAAEKIAYKEEKIIFSGPTFQSMKIEGNRIILNFQNCGSGLVTKDGKELKCFSIAGPDMKFVWARARIEKDKVEVYNDSISNPVAVRYAWADNPDGANLANREGIPASPFRTDK
jgi:sialate O-acetylesterase